jgi:CheY-like chemotaxis protein
MASTTLGRKVLLIDDDPVVITLYAALFRNSGCDVDTAADGEEGLVRLLQYRPDAVLLDLAMPKVNGLEWLRRVHADGAGPVPPIVILTSSDLSLTGQAARNAGATEVLSKFRVDPDSVVQTVLSIVSKSAANA